MMFKPSEKDRMILDKIAPWLDYTKEEDGNFCLKENAPDEIKKLYPEFCKIKFPEI